MMMPSPMAKITEVYWVVSWSGMVYVGGGGDDVFEVSKCFRRWITWDEVRVNWYVE